MNNLYQPVGSFYQDGNCDFVVWAPLKKSVAVCITHPFNRQQAMEKEDAGYWKTTIEIMPVAQFAGNRNWGYDGVYPFAVQNSYGGANGLKMLVNKAHQKGLR